MQVSIEVSVSYSVLVLILQGKMSKIFVFGLVYCLNMVTRRRLSLIKKKKKSDVCKTGTRLIACILHVIGV